VGKSLKRRGIAVLAAQILETVESSPGPVPPLAGKVGGMRIRIQTVAWLK
jgi:hypothetical protein